MVEVKTNAPVISEVAKAEALKKAEIDKAAEAVKVAKAAVTKAAEVLEAAKEVARLATKKHAELISFGYTCKESPFMSFYVDGEMKSFSHGKFMTSNPKDIAVLSKLPGVVMIKK